MKFSTTKNNLLNILLETNKVVPLRTTLPILSCAVFEIKKGKSNISATDLEQTIKCDIDVNIIQEGRAALPVNRLLEIVSALPEGEVSIETKEDYETEINNANGMYKIIGKDPEEFPEEPKLETQQTINLTEKEVLEIITNTNYAVSKDDLKPALCGIYLHFNKNNITAVATDGHRLVKHEKTSEKQNKEGSLIVPSKFFSLIKTTLTGTTETTIITSSNHIALEKKGIKYISRIIKENFPDFNSVIPENLETKAVVDTEQLINCLKRVLIFSNKTTKQVLLTFNKNEIVLQTEDKETRASAKEHLVCDYDHEEITVGYNAVYLKEVIQHLNAKKTEIYLSGPMTAAIIQPDKQKENTVNTALLMPLRINN
tara:strand:+ start:367 stop:1479 length:1113 start_codon:yes stop_codon:yes gene_type:complete